MEQTLMIGQVVLSVVLVALILLQAQGTGLGSTWGGGGETYHTRRGIEKVVFIATIVCTTLFMVSSVALLMM